MAWTEDRVIVLKKLWGAGHSASQIADTIGGVTRNAVIGKVYRLGLSGRAAPTRPLSGTHVARAKSGGRVAAVQSVPVRAESAPAMRSAVPKKPAVQARPVSVPVVERSVVSVFSLRDNMCKWPIGDPSDPEFRFCGGKSATGPYCAEHAKLAFQPNRRREQESQSA